MDVTFATPEGREFTIEVWYFATVREMKEAVHAREGIPVASQRLFLAGGPGRDGDEDRHFSEEEEELDDARDTAHYGIVQGSRFVLVLHDPDAATATLPPPPPSPSPSPSPAPTSPAAARVVAVWVSGPEIVDGTCRLDVPASDTVARLKALLQDRTDGALPAASTALFLGKTEMEDGKKLANYDLPADGGGGMDVSAVVRPHTSPSAVRVVAVWVSGPEIVEGTCMLDVPDSDTVSRLKDLLQDRTDGALPAARTALFLGKVEMEDGKTLADYDPPADGSVMDVSAVVRPQAPAASVGA